jgi:hypothetical protein
MRDRLHSLPFVGAGLLLGLWMLTMAQPSASQRTQHSAPSAPPGTPMPIPADRADDSYAIYALLMPGQPFSTLPPEQNQRWAIAAVTVNEDDRNPAVPPQGQLKPPPENPRGFNEAVGDYQTNKYVRVRLQRTPLHIDHDFALLSPTDVDALRGARSGAQVTSSAQSQWAGYPGVTYFSEVYFSRDHGSALVYMNDWCAHLCAAGTWIYLEKRGGQWVRRSGIVTGGAGE